MLQMISLLHDPSYADGTGVGPRASHANTLPDISFSALLQVLGVLRALLRGLDLAGTPTCGHPGACTWAVSSNPVPALPQVISFLRALLRDPDLAAGASVRDRVRAYVDAFTTWDEPTRVEQYNILHFDWDISGRDKAAVVLRISKALGLAP